MILVTGSTGFVGSAVVRKLAKSGFDVVAAARSTSPSCPEASRIVKTGDLAGACDWREALFGVSVIVHCAARVHVMTDRSNDPLAEFRRVNVNGTDRLARQAAEQGVKRFIFISSIKVNGEASVSGAPFRAGDRPAPVDAYGASKREAEEVLRDIGNKSGMEVVIIRPPLVYGPGVGGNFVRLLQLIEKGYPLPFGLVDNKRSLVGIDNLCDLIKECVENPLAADRKFLVSDGSDVSIGQLVQLLAGAMSRQTRLVRIPVPILRFAASLLGKSDEVLRLFGSLQVDIGETMSTLGWAPPASMEYEIKKTVSWYLDR